MIIKTISLENFRSFKDKTNLDDLKQVNVLVGPKKSGKSNVIMALRFMNSLARNDSTRLFEDNVFDNDSEGEIRIEIELALSREDRKLVLNLISSISNQFRNLMLNGNLLFKQMKYGVDISKYNIVKESLSVLNSTGRYQDLILHKREDGLHNQYVVDLATSLRGITDTKEFDNVALLKREGKWLQNMSILHAGNKTFEYRIGDLIVSFFRNIRIYSPNRNPQQDMGPDETDKSLNGSGDNLVRVLYKLWKTNTKEYVRLLDLMNEILGFSNFRIPDSSGRFRPVITEEGLQSEMSFANLSYGSRQMLTLLVAIEEAKSGETVCIEEPELHIHSTSQKKLFRRIIDKSNDIQFFITTHSLL